MIRGREKSEVIVLIPELPDEGGGREDSMGWLGLTAKGLHSCQAIHYTYFTVSRF